jgi:uncharacterized protein
LTGQSLRLAVIGATGWLGGLFVREALARGHSVTAVVREPAGAARLPEGVASALASIHDTPSLAAAIGGHDAVLSAYRTPKETPELMLPGARALLDAARQRSVARVVWIGGTGALRLPGGVGDIVDVPGFPEEWKPITLAHRDTRDLFRAEAGDLEWTYVSPPQTIEDGERTGAYRVSVDEMLLGVEGPGRISSQDFVVGLLDLIERREHIGEHVTFAY